MTIQSWANVGLATDGRLDGLLSSKALDDGTLMTMKAPLGVSTPLWNLSSASERRAMVEGVSIAAAGAVVITQPNQPIVVPDITVEQLRAIMPNAGRNADLYVSPLNEAMRAHGIDTPQQKAAFLAQISVESGQLRNTVENLNYSARRLTEVWPSRFPTVEAAKPYANKPEALANRVYSNRLGNGDAASGDGWQFRGRGLMQVTGRENYRRVGYENAPEMLANPRVASDTAAAFFQNNGLNARTEATLSRAAFDSISRTVNGGNHGSNERWAAYQRALVALGVE